MGLKDIVLTLDVDATSGRRLAYAAELARLHEARLIGLYVIEPLNLSAYFSPAISGYIAVDAMQEIEQRHRAAAEAGAKKVEVIFLEACSRAGITGEWRLAEGDTAEMGVLHARYADLAVTGQIDPENPPPGSAARLPEQLALASGRPVLIVPYAGKFDTIGRRVLVAWGRTRESARAVNDAMPILKRAEKVSVLSINPEQGGAIPGADIALHQIGRASCRVTL